MTTTNEDAELDQILPKEGSCDIHETMDGCPVIDMKTALTHYIARKTVERAIEELNNFEEWFQQYAYEMHVSHVCPQDNIACAVFRGRSQKAAQIHEELRVRIAELTKQLHKLDGEQEK